MAYEKSRKRLAATVQAMESDRRLSAGAKTVCAFLGVIAGTLMNIDETLERIAAAAEKGGASDG